MSLPPYSEIKGYNPATDSTLPTSGKKRKHEETVDTVETNGETEGNTITYLASLLTGKLT